MAKYKALLNISGKLDGMVFVNNDYGPHVRTAPIPMSKTRKKRKSFKNAMLNAAEWKHATKTAQFLRHSMGEILNGVKNMHLVGHLNSALLEALHLDSVNDWGHRIIINQNLTPLLNFEFNHKLPLEDALPLNIDNHYTVQDTTITLHIPAIRIRAKKALPPTATHYRLISCLLTLDMQAKKRLEQDTQHSPIHPFSRKAGEPFLVTHTVPRNTPGSAWFAGIEFYTLKKDTPVIIKGGSLRLMQWWISEPPTKP